LLAVSRGLEKQCPLMRNSRAVSTAQFFSRLWLFHPLTSCH